MKVLFIDDESLIRKGFQAIIRWKEYGFDKCFEAEDGQEGVEKIMELNPELVLLDIRMQDMDGIEVTKKVRDMGFRGRIIIISGYSDFKYAKSAISYDVTAYLLKPVDITELTEAITKAREELERESLLSVYSGQPMKKSVSNIISDLITGRLEYTSDVALAYNIDFTGGYNRLAVIHPLAKNDKSDRIKDFLKGFKKSPPFTVLIDGEVIILFTSKTSFLEYEYLRDNYILEVKPCELYFIQGERVRDINKLPVYYTEIKKIADNLFYYADSSYTCYYPGFQRHYSIESFNILNQTQNIINSILLLNYSRLEELTAEYAYYLRYKETPIDAISFMIGNSYQQIMAELYTNYPQMEFEFPNYHSFLAKICEFKFLYEYMEYFKKILAKMIFFIRKEKNCYPCKNLCNYIETNYSSPLKLESIAEQFGYNSSYLGKLFKKETGESFNSYIDKIRIKNAKEFLSKNASVSQTAASVGYNDIDYFTKKFKKYVGISPSEYKKTYGGKNSEV